MRQMMKLLKDVPIHLGSLVAGYYFYRFLWFTNDPAISADLTLNGDELIMMMLIMWLTCA